MAADLDLDVITIAIEWENPRDVDSFWIDRAVAGLAAEIERERSRVPGTPTVLYLYDARVIDPESIWRVIARSAPKLDAVTDLHLIPTEGLTYYQLKNRAAQLATTPFIALIDSDACPAPGWLRGLLRPFSDPSTMAVAGVTSLATRDLLSRTMAMVWIFDLPSEHERSRGRRSLHANNFAVRTVFFREHPFPNTIAFKKQCGIWLADIVDRGFGFERTPEALAFHAPHAGYVFLLWRAVQAGLDRDAKARLEGRGRLARIAYSAQVFAKKNFRSTQRILEHHREVELPVWQIPAALLIAWAYYSALAGTQLLSALLDGLPESLRVRWIESS
ncbi:MAG: glycosyltransferase [Myxococcota bacterium]